MRDLAGRVDAGIGAPGADGFDRVVGDAGQRLLEPLLDADATRLALPAIVPATVVLDADGDAHAVMARPRGPARCPDAG